MRNEPYEWMNSRNIRIMCINRYTSWNSIHTNSINIRGIFIELNVNALVLFGEKKMESQPNYVLFQMDFSHPFLFFTNSIYVDLSEWNINIDWMRFEMSEAIAEPVIVFFSSNDFHSFLCIKVTCKSINNLLMLILTSRRPS